MSIKGVRRDPKSGACAGEEKEELSGWTEEERPFWAELEVRPRGPGKPEPDPLERGGFGAPIAR